MKLRAQKILIGTDYNEKDHPAICALVDFATQNSGIQFANYGERNSFRSEQRSIAADLKQFKAALYQASLDRVTDADVIAEAPHAFSGRLELVGTLSGFDDERDGKRVKILEASESTCVVDSPDYRANIPKERVIFACSYCTGQYFPTEYRKAAATLLEYAARRVRQARPPTKRTVFTIADLKALNAENGGCWFEPATMRFFKAKIVTGILTGGYFITSEQGPSGVRAYSLRSFDEKGAIDTVGEFQAYGTKAQAMSAYREMRNPEPVTT